MQKGYIYILTNPSFPEYVKIGYADDVFGRLKQLNRSECTPFAFRLYAYYEVGERLQDKKIHELIDRLNPTLRSVEELEGKVRKREFYRMPASDAYSLLQAIASINGLEDKLVLVEPSAKDIKEEEDAEEIRTRKKPRQLPKMDWMIEQGLVKVGDRIFVISHPEDKAEIIDESHVLFKGKKISFNQFGCEVTGWKAIQIYACAKVESQNKTLDQLRRGRMEELGLLNN